MPLINPSYFCNKRKNLKPIFAACLVLLIILHSCTPPVGVFEKNIVIPDHAWTSDFKPTMSFEIKDTVSYYRMYVVLRHSDAYRYKNIWLSIGVQSPGDSMYYNRKNLPLASDDKPPCTAARRP